MYYMFSRMIIGMKLNALEILENIKKVEKSDRKPVNMYLSHKLWSQFKAACDDVAPSKVIEELLTQFIASKQDDRKKQ